MNDCVCVCVWEVALCNAVCLNISCRVAFHRASDFNTFVNVMFHF